MLKTKYQNRNYLRIIFFIIMFSSCNQGKNNNTQKIISDNYSLIVASDFERTNSLNELSKVQFQNIKENLYFIVLEEPKERFKNAIKLKLHKSTPDLMGYLKVVTNHFKEVTDNFELSDVGFTKIDSCNAVVFSMSGINPEDNRKIYYRYALIEDENNYYQIMSWTNLKNKLKLIGKMEETIHSFKRI